ncbi:hypothetical protein BSL78_24480 [Apostichopus japonicus]|uniref:Sushi domain-containing protein n=1 Tax=Stichopus japonicus TaxID=307972 RepID=A0A2G8JSD4_STIJA|nr:hypothetical protein BSL78_24480 [Apostichopus japonicus]
MHSTVSCYIEKARGNTAHPCYGDGSIITCSCKSDKFQLSSPDNSYLCRPDEWEDGLYDLHCLTASPCDEPAPPHDLVFHRPDFAEGEMYANGTEIMYYCPADGLDLNGHMTAVCLYGVWTHEDAYCTDRIHFKTRWSLPTAISLSGHDLDETTILGPLYREIHWSSTKFLAIPETAVTFFPAMLQNRRRTSSHNQVKHKSNFSPTKYHQSQSKISFIATNSWRNELPQRRQKFFTFSEIKTGKL